MVSAATTVVLVVINIIESDNKSGSFSNNKIRKGQYLMEDKRLEELLLQLMQDIAVVKAKLTSIEEIKLDAKTLGTRVDNLEAQNREHDRIIKSLENRASTMEQFTRNNMSDAKKQMTSVYVSLGVALFSAVLSVISGLLF